MLTWLWYQDMSSFNESTKLNEKNIHEDPQARNQPSLQFLCYNRKKRKRKQLFTLVKCKVISMIDQITINRGKKREKEKKLTTIETQSLCTASFQVEHYNIIGNNGLAACSYNRGIPHVSKTMLSLILTHRSFIPLAEYYNTYLMCYTWI